MSLTVSKFTVLKLLVVTSMMQAGSLTSARRRFWFVDKHGLLYLITMCILAANLYSQLNSVLIKTPSPPDIPYENGTTEDKLGLSLNQDQPQPPLIPTDSNSLIKSPGHEMQRGENKASALDELSNNDKSNSTNSHDKMDMVAPDEIVRLSKDSSKILNNIMNLVLRLLNFMLFPKIISTFQRLISRPVFVPGSYAWTKQELVFLILILLSCLLQMEQTISETIRSAQPSPSPQNRNENQSENSSSWPSRHRERAKQTFETLMSFIYCFILESFPMECVTAVLITFTTVIAKNLEVLTHYLDSSSAEQESSCNSRIAPTPTPTLHDLESLVVFNLSHEYPILGRMVNLNMGGNTDGIKENKEDGYGLKFKSREPDDVKQGSSNENHVFFIKTKTQIEMYAFPPTKNGHNYSDSIRFVFGRYFELLDLWKETQDVTGFATFLIVLNVTINLCIYSFMGVSGFLDLGLTHESTITNGMRALLSTGKLICLTNAGQLLLNAVEDLEEKILFEYWNHNPRSKSQHEHQVGVQRRESQRPQPDDNDFAEFSTSSSCCENQLLYLLHHMSSDPINLSALGFFTTSRSTFVSIGGVILSYLFVLIQFRSSS